MSDSIQFDKDGTYRRGGKPVENMDVQSGQTPSSASEAPKSAVKSVGAPDAPKTPKPGSFDLNALRSSVMQSSTTVTETKLPEQGAISLKQMEKKPVVKTEEAPKEVPAATEVTASKEPATPVKAVESDVPKAADGPAKEVAETPTVTPSETVVSSSVQSAPVVPPVPAPTPEAVKESQSFNLDKLKQQSKAAEPEVKPAEKAAEPVKEESTPAPAPAEQPKAVETMSLDEEKEEPALTKEDEQLGFTGEGFKLSTLQDFCVQSGISQGEIIRWCKKCMKAVPTMPAAILAWSGDAKVRFYNCIYTQSGDRVNVVLGCGDYVVCVSVDFRKATCYEGNQHIALKGKDVTDKHGDLMAIYSERLRKSFVV